jgi:hypothetical protein
VKVIIPARGQIMKIRCRATYAVLIAASLLALPGHSTSFSTDQSDLYYAPGESGWALELVQRGPVIFATLLVYDQANAPTWFVAVMNNMTPGPIFGNTSWTGDLYATKGPYFATEPFDPIKATATKVGTTTWLTFENDYGNFFYSVNGVSVSKFVVRETIVVDDYSGAYKGAIHHTTAGCADPARNTGPLEAPAAVSVIQSGRTIALTISADDGVTTNVTGAVNQYGQFGAVDGTYARGASESGNAHITEMNVQLNALAMSFDLISMGICHDQGYFAGIRSRK